VKIITLSGDATNPQLNPENDMNYIIHCCNDAGKWGKGFVLPLASKWPRTKAAFKSLYTAKRLSSLGDNQYIVVEKNITVVNMIGQRGTYVKGSPPPIRYPAIQECLIKLSMQMRRKSPFHKNPAIHCPRFGTNLAGGSWEDIVKILKNVFNEVDINIYVYDYYGPH